jgi:hypothetical protein
MILSRVANTGSVTTPVNGMVVYDVSEKCFRGYQNGAWTACGLVEGTIIKDVISDGTGRIWMDRNLGASQAATSSTDPASYGDLYQWGRKTDGHQRRTSATTSGPVASGSEGANYIIFIDDWLDIADDTLWNSGTEIEPAKTPTDPCPTGYRIPSGLELDAEFTNGLISNSADAFNSKLKLPAAGNRDNPDGIIYNTGTIGTYWSNKGIIANGFAFNKSFDVTAVYSNENHRAKGFSVRCIKEE